MAAIVLSITAVAESVIPPRTSNSTLRMPSKPQLFDWHTQDAFPGLQIQKPVTLVVPTGETNRLFVAEQGGRVVVISDLSKPQGSVFLDLSSRTFTQGESGLLGLEFHPGYHTNGYFFVFYTCRVNTVSGFSVYDRLSRFQVSKTNPNLANANSELILISQVDRNENHNGGDLHFGPDGYLYVSLGDEGGGNDLFGNSQRIDSFFSGILRIDVDKRPGNLAPNPHPASTRNYWVPKDNPFIGITDFFGTPVDPKSVRTEFYAVGLRNPWRFSFDPPSGLLYCNDVGQQTREEINLIVKGGNYGWAQREGTMTGPLWNPSIQQPYIDPIAEYGRESGDSISGGVVYRGNRIPQLYGAYVFSDFLAGFIGVIRHQEGKTTPIDWILWDDSISTFGLHPQTGDLLLADWGENKIKRLVPGPDPQRQPLPNTLAQTGVFSSVEKLTPNPGIIPYEINLPFWSDHAKKSRWFSVPNPADKISFNADQHWTFPENTIWIKHFELELTNGVPSSRRRLETRILVQGSGNTIYGVSYRWDSHFNATLVPSTGLNEAIVISDSGLTKTQIWHYPSRRECFSCHNGGAGFSQFVLGFDTPQLNRMVSRSGLRQNQLAALSHAGYFSTPIPDPDSLIAFSDPADLSKPLEDRARSYLAVNCAYCHQQPDAISRVKWDGRVRIALDETSIINGPLTLTYGDHRNRVIAPGSLDHSILYQRLAALKPGRMPPLATSVVNTQAVNLIAHWIGSPARVDAQAADDLVTLQWPSPPGALGFNVKRRDNGSSIFTTIASNLLSNSYLDYSAVNNRKYTYAISALYPSGESMNSTALSISPGKSPNAPLLDQLGAESGLVKLTWSLVPGGTVYRIKRSRFPNGPFETIAELPPTNRFDDLSVTNNTVYYYAVTALNAFGESPIPNPLAALPVHPRVSVRTTRDRISESGETDASFLVQRTGPTNETIVVFYAMGGLAVPGRDYQLVSGTVPIHAGARSAAIPIRGLQDGLKEGTESVTITLLPGPRYTLGRPDYAGILIADMDYDTDGDGLTDAEEFLAGTNPEYRYSVFRITSLSCSSDGKLNLAWTAVPGISYKVWYTKSLLRPEWLPASPSILAVSDSIEWSGHAWNLGNNAYFKVTLEPSPAASNP